MLEIQMRRCVLVLTEQELLSLLALRPALWREAIRRGKAVQRARAAAERERRESHALPRG